MVLYLTTARRMLLNITGLWWTADTFHFQVLHCFCASEKSKSLRQRARNFTLKSNSGVEHNAWTDFIEKETEGRVRSSAQQNSGVAMSQEPECCHGPLPPQAGT
jgi:hypothetical protein